MASLVDNKLWLTSGGFITVMLGTPSQPGWIEYVWIEAKDWLRVMLTPPNPNLEPYPLSWVGKTLSWLLVIGAGFGVWMLLKPKRKGRKHG